MSNLHKPERLKWFLDRAKTAYADAHREEIEEEQKQEARFATMEAEQEALIVSEAALDQKLAKAGEIEKVEIVAEEIVNRSMVAWALVVGISILGILAVRFLGIPAPYLYVNSSTTTSTTTDTKAVIRIPRLPFARPWFERGKLDGWKLIVNFYGRTFLQDEDGARVRVDKCQSASIDGVFNHRTASDYIVESWKTKANLADLSRRIEPMRRLLVLTVEGLRKSRDFHRSNQIEVIRETILERIDRDIQGNDPIHAELNLRKEEEKLSE